MVDKTRTRFMGGHGPDGTPWVPSQRAKKTGGKTLIDTQRLMASVAHNPLPTGVEWGTNVAYAEIHQQGGTIDIFARSQQIYRHVDRHGELGTRFVRRSKSNFANYVEIKAYQITIPARPYVGIDEEDKREAAATLKTRMVAVMIDGANKSGGVR
jgi:phage gpG-like protein